MFKRAINKDGKTVHIDNYRTREAAHADKPFTDTKHIGLKLTPVITDENECHFRVVPGCTNSTGGGPMRPEHFITQKMFERIFNSKDEFWVKYRRFPGPKYKHAWTKLDLKRYYIRNSITEFIEVVNADEGMRQSLIGSLKLQNESLLDEYLKVLGDSFIAE